MSDSPGNTNRSEDAVQKLVYGISHDLGAPLRAVVQFSQLLEQRLDDELDEKARYWLQLMREGGRKAQDMVDALLRYSRLSSRMRPPRHFSLHGLVQAVIDEQLTKYRYAYPRSPLPHCEVTAPLGELTGVMEHWHLFFSCLIENALLFQPRNQPDHTPRVNIYCANATRIVIEDNGIGVAENRWADLTRPFMRGQTEADYPGLGMGLSYCDRIAQLHGGNLDFDLSSLGGLAIIYTYRDRETSNDDHSQTSGN